MKRKLIKIGISLGTLLLCFNFTLAQEFDLNNYRLIYKFSNIKQADNTRKLSVSFMARHKKNRKDRIPIYQSEINFINYTENDEVILGSTLTDKAGIAEIIVPANFPYLTDNEGYINLEGRFNKTDFLPKKTSKIRLKNIDLSMDLVVVDSVRTVLVTAYEKDSLGLAVPVDELDIIISIGSMFSKMPLDNATIRSGEYRFEFPTDLPGEFDGNLSIYSIIEDHDDYGDVIQEESAYWGLARPIVEENNRMLWSSAAPYWMYVVLTIMLVGVWANYIYTIFNLFKLKKEGQALEYN